jgi:heme exporter protein D
MWKAESENASRYSVQTNLLMTLVLALGGVALAAMARLVTPATLDLLRHRSERWGAWLCFGGFVASIFAALALLYVALIVMFRESRVTEADLLAQRQAREERDAQKRAVTSLPWPTPSTASKHMELPSETVESLPEPMGEALYLIFVRTYEASIDLGARNDNRSGQLRRSRRWVFAALFAGVLAATLYVFSLAFLSDATEDLPAKEVAREQAVHDRPAGATNP